MSHWMICTCCGRYSVEQITRVRHPAPPETLLRLHWPRAAGDTVTTDYTDPRELLEDLALYHGVTDLESIDD